jgi:hypothetical protein
MNKIALLAIKRLFEEQKIVDRERSNCLKIIHYGSSKKNYNQENTRRFIFQ